MTSKMTSSGTGNFSVLIIPDGCAVVEFEGYAPWNNPKNVITIATLTAFDRFKTVFVVPILFIISTFTNSVNMAVFFKQGLQDRVNVCLFALAFIDFVYVFFGFSLFGEQLYFAFVEKSYTIGPIYRFITNNNINIFFGCIWASDFVSTLIAVDRCFCVVRPFRAQNFLSSRTVAGIIISACAVLVGGYYVISARWKTTCAFDPLNNTTSHQLYPSQFYLQNRGIIDLLDGVLYGFILPAGFLVTVATSTTITTIYLRRAMAWRETTSSSSLSTKEAAVTRMLIGTSILYVVCKIPLVAFRILILAVPELSLTGYYYNLFNLFVSITEIMSFITSSVNFFIYYPISTKYREVFWTLFHLKAPRKVTSVAKTSSVSLK